MDNIFDLSIVIPAYNCEKTIQKCLDSVLCCDSPGYEVIVIDDGSTDNTYTVVCDEFNGRVNLIHQENSGVSVARNRGIKEAKNKYIMFLDSDDCFCENWWKAIERDIKKEYDFIIYDYMRESNNKVIHHNTLNNVNNFEKNSAILVYVLADDLNSSWAKIYKRELLNAHNISFPKGVKIGEDAIFVGEVLRYCQNPYYSSYAYYIYVDNPNSASYKVLKDFNDQEKLFTFKEILMFEKVSKSYVNDFYTKFFGDFVSKLKQNSNSYKEFSYLINIALQYQYVNQLINYNYEKLSIRRKIQKILLKNRRLFLLYVEIMFEKILTSELCV